ncbi:50S ribosomal protein L34 [Candidatus Peregrinibacteria bacterium]|nr:50S ribosomal protein L34 [Candidatus Peregrinibacteria bacterium]
MQMLSKRNQRKMHKRHGFLKRMDSKGGKTVLNRRRSKGRKKLSV